MAPFNLTTTSFRYFDLPAEIRLRVLQSVLEDDNRGFQSCQSNCGQWAEIHPYIGDLPAEELYVRAYLRPFDWAYRGLRLCSRQVAAELSMAHDGLRTRSRREPVQRKLDIYLAPSREAVYLTWTGPAWAPITPHDLTIVLRAEAAYLRRTRQPFAAGRAGAHFYPGGFVTHGPFAPEAYVFLDRFQRHGPRLGGRRPHGEGRPRCPPRRPLDSIILHVRAEARRLPEGILVAGPLGADEHTDDWDADRRAFEVWQEAARRANTRQDRPGVPTPSHDAVARRFRLTWKMGDAWRREVTGFHVCTRHGGVEMICDDSEPVEV